MIVANRLVEPALLCSANKKLADISHQVLMTIFVKPEKEVFIYDPEFKLLIVCCDVGEGGYQSGMQQAEQLIFWIHTLASQNPKLKFIFKIENPLNQRYQVSY